MPPRFVLPPPPKPPPPPPPLVTIVVASGTDCFTISSSRSMHVFGELDARADRQLGVDVDLAFVGLRQQLGADPRVKDDRKHDEPRRCANHRRPVLQRHVHRCGGTASSTPFEEPFARPVEARRGRLIAC